MNHLVSAIYFLAAVIAAVHGNIQACIVAGILSILAVKVVPPHAANITINNPPGIRSEVE